MRHGKHWTLAFWRRGPVMMPTIAVASSATSPNTSEEHITLVLWHIWGPVISTSPRSNGEAPLIWVVLIPNAPRLANGCCFSLCFIRPITGLYILSNAHHLYQGNAKLWWNSKISRRMSLVAFIPTCRIYTLCKGPCAHFHIYGHVNNHICYLTYDLY